jgi:predicted phage tail protein
LNVTWGIAMLVVGLTIGIVAAIIAEGTLRTVLFAVGLLLLVGGVVVLETARRR